MNIDAYRELAKGVLTGEQDTLEELGIAVLALCKRVEALGADWYVKSDEFTRGAVERAALIKVARAAKEYKTIDDTRWETGIETPGTLWIAWKALEEALAALDLQD